MYMVSFAASRMPTDVPGVTVDDDGVLHYEAADYEDVEVVEA